MSPKAQSSSGAMGAKGKRKAKEEEEPMIGSHLPLPKISQGAKSRYKTLYSIRSSNIKIEGSIETPLLDRLGVIDLFQSTNLYGWIEVWNRGHVEDWVYSFIAHLTLDEETKIFSTNVEGVNMVFKAKDVCDLLNITCEGVNPLEFRDRDSVGQIQMYTHLGGTGLAQSRGLFRENLPLMFNAAACVLQCNIMPQKGGIRNKLALSHLKLLYAIVTHQKINFEPIIFDVLKQMANREVEVVAYHRLITFLCSTSRVPLYTWKMLYEPKMDKRMLERMEVKVPRCLIAISEEEEEKDIMESIGSTPS